jgi:type VI secretion system protein VasG
MTIVPYFPIGRDVLRQIVDLKLGHVAARLCESHNVKLSFAPAVPDAIAARCQEADTGARNVDHIVREHLLPVLATAVLSYLADGEIPPHITVGLDDQSNFAIIEGAAPSSAATAAA